MPEETPGLAEADNRLIRSVDALPDAEYAEPSLLPGWSRAHVIAHLVLNAEALSGALRGVIAGNDVPMYPSQERRDGDIADLAAEPPGALRDRLLAGTSVFGETWAALSDSAHRTEFERTPGGRRTLAVAAGWMRHREVEIHHADLGLDYDCHSWPPAFVERLIETTRQSRAGHVTLVATDLAQEWPGEEQGPTVSGASTELAWWITGRPAGPTMTSDDGVLPILEAW